MTRIPMFVWMALLLPALPTAGIALNLAILYAHSGGETPNVYYNVGMSALIAVICGAYGMACYENAPGPYTLAYAAKSTRR